MPECTHENEIQLLETQNNQLMREKAAVEQETLTYREEFFRLQQELDRERHSREQDAINHRFLSEAELKSEETRRRTAETKAERVRLELEQLERSAALKTANILSVLHSRNARILQLEALLDEKNGDDARPVARGFPWPRRWWMMKSQIARLDPDLPSLIRVFF